MTLIENQTFTGGRVEVDNKTFRKCDFTDVTLVFAGGRFEFEAGCSFQRISHHFEGSALATINYLKAFSLDLEKLTAAKRKPR